MWVIILFVLFSSNFALSQSLKQALASNPLNQSVFSALIAANMPPNSAGIVVPNLPGLAAVCNSYQFKAVASTNWLVCYQPIITSGPNTANAITSTLPSHWFWDHSHALIEVALLPLLPRNTKLAMVLTLKGNPGWQTASSLATLVTGKYHQPSVSGLVILGNVTLAWHGKTVGYRNY